jgi:hypothetical protein
MASITRFYALILSTVLLLSGVPGFFPTIGSLQVLASFFELTLVHSVVHVAVGLLGLMITALASDDSVRIYTIGIALLYGALMVIGIIGINFAPVLYFNSADNWLHGSIFVLSLGVFLAGIAEDRLSQRKAYLEEGLPHTQRAQLAGRAGIPATSPAPASWQTNMGAPAAAPMPWSNQPHFEQQTTTPWGQGSWQQWQQNEQSQPQYQPQYQPHYQLPPQQQPLSQPRSPQPPNQPQDFSQEPLRDPWSREQRHAPYREPSRPARAPSPDQQSNPWSQYPSQPGPRQPSQWPQSQPQPPQDPSPWNPWPEDAQFQNGQHPSQPRHHRQMDEWPPIQDPRPSQ